MNLFQLVLKQMRQRALSTWLTLLSVIIGSALAVSVLILRRESGALFAQSDFGYDVIIGAKGSPMTLVLNTVYHVDQSPGLIPYIVHDALKNDPRVKTAVPFAIGDTYKGLRVTGTTPEMFGFDPSTGSPMRGYDEMGRLLPGYNSPDLPVEERHPEKPTAADTFNIRYPQDPADKNASKFTLSQGRIFHPRKFEAVIGAEVPERAGLKIGDKFKVAHNAVPGRETEEDQHAEEWTVVGILNPTHTAEDRALFIPLVSFYAIPQHEWSMDLQTAMQRGEDLARFDKAPAMAATQRTPATRPATAPAAKAVAPVAAPAKREHDHDHDHAHDEKPAAKKEGHDHGHDHDHDHDHAKKPATAASSTKPTAVTKPAADAHKHDDHDHGHAHGDDHKHDHAPKAAVTTQPAAATTRASMADRAAAALAGAAHADDHDHDHAHDHGHAHKPATTRSATTQAAASPAHKHDDHDHDHDHGAGEKGKDAHAGHGHDHEHLYNLNPDGTINLTLPRDRWQLSGVLVRSKGGPANMMLQYSFRNSSMAAAVNPAGVMREFFRTFLGPTVLVLLVIALMVVVTAGVSILVSIYNAVSSRSREIAIMRALGATRGKILTLICVEAALIGLLGGLIGLVVGHAIGAFESRYFVQRLGIGINWLVPGWEEWVYLGGVVVLATLAGLVPGLKAYRTPVATNLVAA